MAKRTIIINEQQLNEIIGGNSEYLDNADNDYREYLDNEVMATSKTDTGNDGDPITTDNISKKMSRSNDSFGFTRQIVPGGYTTECTVKEWRNKHNLNEDNQDLVNRNFKSNGENISYNNMTTKISRLNKIKNSMGNAFHGTPQEAELNSMEKSYDNAKNISKRNRENKKNLGMNVIKSAPKQSGNGKAHVGKNKNNGGIITYKN